MEAIGLTGGIATGKTTVSCFLDNLNVPIIDADTINQQLLLPNQPGYNEILKAFPNISLLKDHFLDKKHLHNKIFNDKRSKKLLETLLHPLIKEEINTQLNQLKNHSVYTYCIISVPLMIEANFQHLVSKLWVCDCSQNSQLKRLMARDEINQSDAELIIKQQLSRQDRLRYADEIIPTEHKIPMEEKIKYLHHQQIKLNS